MPELFFQPDTTTTEADDEVVTRVKGYIGNLSFCFVFHVSRPNLKHFKFNFSLGLQWSVLIEQTIREELN